jgi:hypothetical protein
MNIFQCQDVWAKKWDATASLAFAFENILLNLKFEAHYHNGQTKNEKKYLESSQEEDARTHQSSRRICYH